MTAIEVKALKIRAANDNGRTAEDFGVLKLAVTTTHGQWALPSEFSGRFAKFLVVGASGDLVHVGFSRTTGREVDSAATAAAAGSAPTKLKVGWPLQHGLVEHHFVPDWRTHAETFYLVAEGSASVTLYVQLADGH